MTKLDEYEQVQQMRGRMDDLQGKVEAALGAAAMFTAALYDELGRDAETEYVASRLAAINQQLGDQLVELHELAAHLY